MGVGNSYSRELRFFLNISLITPFVPLFLDTSAGSKPRSSVELVTSLAPRAQAGSPQQGVERGRAARPARSPGDLRVPGSSHPSAG